MADQVKAASISGRLAETADGSLLLPGRESIWHWEFFMPGPLFPSKSPKNGDGTRPRPLFLILWPSLVFAFMMVPAGRLQDKFGPRLVATLGGIFCGIGFIVASLGQSLMGLVIGFGILAGTGIGFGYASATPPAVKWFPPARTGLIAGLVVAGFGLASVYIAPLANHLLGGFWNSEHLPDSGNCLLDYCSAPLPIDKKPSGGV